MRPKYIVSLGILIFAIAGCGTVSQTQTETSTQNPPASEAHREGKQSTPPPAAENHPDAEVSNKTEIKLEAAPKSTVVPSTADVAISNFAFAPGTLTVKKGTTITWKNNDDVGHTVTSNQGTELSSSILNKGDVYSHTFNTVGTFGYHCSPHPSMHGSITVTE